jgi:hypothetical protein
MESCSEIFGKRVMKAATATINTAVRNNMDMNQPNGTTITGVTGWPCDTGSDYPQINPAR